MNNKLSFINSQELELRMELFYLNGMPYSGFGYFNQDGNKKSIFKVENGRLRGIHCEFDEAGNLELVGLYNDLRHGYQIEYKDYGDLFVVFDVDVIVELIQVDKFGARKSYYNIMDHNNTQRIKKYNPDGSYEITEQTLEAEWRSDREKFKEEGYYTGDYDIIPNYFLQKELREHINQEDSILSDVQYIAAATVVHNQFEQKMIGVVLVFKANSLEIVEQTYSEMTISFPYIESLFSWRETPLVIEAFNKLTVRPDLIICNGHGLTHPIGIGWASQLGLELNIPTLACSRYCLIGGYKPVEQAKGSFAPLIFDDKPVGCVLRTQTNSKPLFVSVGHCVSIKTARDWILRLCNNTDEPTIFLTMELFINTLMEERTISGFPES